jgi:site-specific recombinase XerD
MPIFPVTLDSTIETPSTLTIKVQTRHAADCPERADIYSRRCDCRKQLWIYENGRDRTESAKTRSWAQAEKIAAERLAERDPARIQARLLEQERARLLAVEEEKAAAAAAALVAAQARRVSIDAALDEWFAGIKPKSNTRTNQFKSIIGKIKSWAQEKELAYLDEITPAALYAWVGQWSENARNDRDCLAPASQNIYITYLHRFFKWSVMVDYLAKDPSVIVKAQAFERDETRPLSTAAQFDEILEATWRMDENRFRSTPEYGRDLRAIFLLQRFTGIRIGDALTLERRALRVCPITGRTLLTLKTRKTGKVIKDRPLPVAVVAALAEIPAHQEHVRPGFYFWANGLDVDNLTNTWTKRILKHLNPWLALVDDDGRPMAFHSHMLRDTFAVELLVAGVDIHEVSNLLTHKSIAMTEKYYAPWVTKRMEKLHETMVAAMEKTGASFTPAARPRPAAGLQLIQ